LPIVSDPTDEDTDGDGYADGPIDCFGTGKVNDPRPMISDVTVTKLKGSENWIKIERSYYQISDENFIDYGDYSYGGQQAWMSNKEISLNAENVLSSGGCGIVAGSDIITYLAMKNGYNFLTYNLTGIDIFNKGINDSSAIGMTEYTQYMISMGNNHFEPWTGIPKFISGGTTTWGITSNNYVKYFNNLNISVKATARSVHPNFTPSGMGAIIVTQNHRDKLLEDVKKSMKNDMPVTILYLFNNARWYDYDKYLLLPLGDKKLNHWINVTEVTEDRIMDKTILTISNWGDKQQIIWEEFVSATEYFGMGNRVILYE
jgi:hypothetical protein